MSDLVPADRIEELVGARRRATLHLARADSVVERVYVLHSAECLASGVDLRECPYSLALDAGVLHADWVEHEDQPVVVAVREDDGYLVPVAPWTAAQEVAFDFVAASFVDALSRVWAALGYISEARADRAREIRVSVDRRRRARRRRGRRRSR